MKRLLLTFFALVAIAAGMQATDYGFKMLHTPITSDNYQSESAGKAWSYDPAANVLHLKDGYITPTIPGDVTILEIDGDVNPSLKIQVDGNCRFSGSFAIGILFTGNGNHTICGEGTLTMNSDKVNPKIIESYGSTSLTIKDVTINIQAWGDLAVGFSSVRFREVILDYCEINIKTPVYAWAAFGGNGVEPVLKNCYLSNGSFSDGDAVDATGSSHIKEVYIKRAIFVYDVAVTVDEPVAGNVVSTNCTPNSDDYYVDDFFWVRFDGRSYDYASEGSTFNKGESYTVYVSLVPKEGERFADEKDMKVYVNGKEGEIFHWGAESMTLRYTFPQLEFEKYDLWVGATQVAELNQEDVFGDGYVSYDPSTKTLTLKGGTYQGTSSIQSALGCGIFSQIDGLTIDVQGETYATGADDNEGIRLSGESNIITGNAKLIARGYNGLCVDNSLTVSGNVELEAVGSHAGLIGRWRTRPEVVYYSTLIIKDNAKVRALGDTQASVGRLKEIILADGFSVTAPEGATVGEHSVVDANGNDVIGDEVRIERTKEAYKEAYAVYTDDNKTLTFYYDNQRSSRTGTTYDLNTGETKPDWINEGPEIYLYVTKVVFDPSFANARPTTTCSWFLGMQNLQSIAGMSYLNTSEVTNMSWMFTYCDELTSLDVSNFNTSKVTNMAAMFCDCSSLTSLDVSNFNTENVYDMGNMFKECSSLTSLDLSSFNTSNVYRMYYMFQYCYNLRTIYVGEGWSTAVADRTFDMFDNCTSLVGGQGTTYDASHTDHTYAHIDGGPSNPGYFTDANSIVYDLWIAGTQASALNKNDILGDGKVSFDPGTNTLTLNNANIHAATGYGIQSKLSYVKIVLIGENTITADNGMGVRFQPGAEEPDKAIIRGGGSLNIKASTVGLRSHLDLFLQYGAKITSEGGTVGFQGWKPASHAPLPTLTMTQLDTMLETKGARQGSLVDFGQLNLHRGMVIMQPSGATYAQDIGIMKDNSVVANEWVMICSQDYIDGISPTPAASRIGGETFNLAGQMVDGKYKGIVIKDGKKVLVK